jgi:hypothetical protein
LDEYLDVLYILRKQRLSDAFDRKYGESCCPTASSTRPIRTTSVARTTALRFTRDVAVRHKPENGNTKEQDIMTTSVSIPEVTQLLIDPRGRDAEPIENPVLTDAEEEEIAELWAHDPGNQGA